MRYLAFASDFDETLARNGLVDETTVAAVRRLKDSGRKVLLVTGRELEDLLRLLPHRELFDLIVAENGALLYSTSAGQSVRLGEGPPAALVDDLRHAGVEPLSVGQSIIATTEAHKHFVLAAIQRHGLEWQITFNKGSVMVLPSGVNKATGLRRALKDLNIEPGSTIGIGDAENDHAFLEICGFSAAVANALPSLKERADIVTQAEAGAGVAELIERVLDDEDKLVPRFRPKAKVEPVTLSPAT
jgi:HAD superfamily hydrolase (TIGR01484 family)